MGEYGVGWGEEERGNVFSSWITVPDSPVRHWTTGRMNVWVWTTDSVGWFLLPWPKQACPLSFFLLLNLSVIKYQETSKQPNGAKRRAIIAKNSCGVHWGFQKVRDAHGCEWTSDLPAVGEGGSSYIGIYMAPIISCVFSCSVISDSLATPWIIALQAPLSMGFSRQEYWSGVPSVSCLKPIDWRLLKACPLSYLQWVIWDVVGAASNLDQTPRAVTLLTLQSPIFGSSLRSVGPAQLEHLTRQEVGSFLSLKDLQFSSENCVSQFYFYV